MTTATPARLLVRPITAEDNPAIAHVIREVSAEHGLTADKGYTVSDPNLDALYQLYSLPRSICWSDRGGRRSPAAAASRRCRAAQTIFANCRRCISCRCCAARDWRNAALQALDFARQHGFRCCYLETTASLTQAVALYEHTGFEHIDHAMGATGHVDCEVTMLKTL